jgi:Na+-transporting methylmalonyl-CoA/oxaloacetate decarboxylase beta subunit
LLGIMIRKIAIIIDILGIIFVLSPLIIFCVAKVFFGFGNDAVSVAIIGGADGPTSIFLTAKISSEGIILSTICACILILNILALRRGKKKLSAIL